jgi:hypothetical protein
MAQRREVQFIDDLDGSPADATVSFAIGGVAYEIDLSAVHAETFRRALQPYIAAARRAGSSGERSRRRTRGGRPRAATIRNWARTEGLVVSDRGRIPTDLAVRYRDTVEAASQVNPSREWDPGDQP